MGLVHLYGRRSLASVLPASLCSLANCDIIRFSCAPPEYTLQQCGMKWLTCSEMHIQVCG
ncbi:hypothetical protein ASPFODRAFT_41184 [Aspergillus luchuensis CBS 106.47]|uniref:Uncharacterized protein n=1 Tax=Aspergillus luchuensis (strain CBS 106.47) TaxID=1137211 RepID=A0A1M3TVX8_ASPLC|nr:hypothetical protein ASPFODRAFT_41184 [Aspergillus luchuensis CBS 106.47]